MMDSPVDSMPLSELTDRIIACFYTVYNSLGFGFLEKVYENAFVHELNKQGLNPTLPQLFQISLF